MSKLFQNKGRAASGMIPTTLDHMVESLQSNLNRSGNSFADKATARSAISMESMSEPQMVVLDQSIEHLAAALESIGTANKIKYTRAQIEAGTVAGVVSGDIAAFLRAPVQHSVVATEGMSFLQAQGGDFQEKRMSAALEAYDEKENKNAVTYSVAYNLQAARQDEFGEAFYPTVTVTPDQVGFTVSIRLINVMNEVRRQVSGKIDNFGKRNIIQAVIDPTILKNDSHKLIPVHRAESAGQFVAVGDVAPRTVKLEGVSIVTAPLAVGKNISLLGISQTEALLETGLMDSTDSLDTALALEVIYIKLASGAVLKFNTQRLPLATFTYAVQGNYRQMNLAFKTESLLVNKNVKAADGSVVAALAPIVDGNLSIRLSLQVSGSVNLELADTNVFASAISVARVSDAAGTELDFTTAGAAKTAADLFAGAQMIGYDLDARRTNLNARERGQLLDTTFYNQVYAVPLRSPITVLRPQSLGDANDSSDLAALITATHIRTSAAAVDELLRVQDLLAEYVNSADNLGETPEILGVARFLVKPTFERVTLNVDDVIDSLTSHERAADIQAALVNKLRDMVYRMYRDSGYKAAADALAGGASSTPTVIIGTDPVLARYLMVDGDLRTLGGDFDVKVVSTLNQRMIGKIVMTFGEFGAKDGVPNPMHFGNMAWKPELTLVLPLHRNGANSKELTVQPAFLHITNLPILAVLDVAGIQDVVSAKVAIDMNAV